MSTIQLNLVFSPVAEQKPAKISWQRQRFLLRRALLQQKAYFKKKMGGAPSAQKGRPRPTGPHSQRAPCFGNGLLEGRGSHRAEKGSGQAGRGSNQAGKGSGQAGRRSNQAGKGSRQVGRGSQQAGKGSSQAGRGSHQAGKGSHQAGKGSHQAGKGSNAWKFTPSSSSSSISQPFAPPSASALLLSECRSALPPPGAALAPPKPYKCVAVDCEMVGTRGKQSELARCSIVSYHGDVIYDKYVRPLHPITDYRTRWSGVCRHHMKEATPFNRAREEILRILRGKIVIGHAIHNDFKAMKYVHPPSMTRDTMKMSILKQKAGFPEKDAVSLKKLTKALFDKDIQVGSKGHSSVEDARATMDLYRLVEAQVEQDPESSQK